MNLRLLLLLPSFCFAIGHPVGQTPDVSRLSVNHVAYHGSGCPPNSIFTQLSNDGKSLSLSYSGLAAHLKACQVKFTVAHPHGWHYSIESTTFKGHKRLLQGETVTFHTVYDFDNPSSKVSTKAVAASASDGFFASSETEKTVWSTCGDPTAISIDTNVEIEGDNDSDDAVEQVIVLKWRRC